MELDYRTLAVIVALAIAFMRLIAMLKKRGRRK